MAKGSLVAPRARLFWLAHIGKAILKTRPRSVVPHLGLLGLAVLPGFAGDPVLTGLVQGSRGGWAYFQCPADGPSFRLRIGQDWGSYHLESIDFHLREAVLLENQRRMVIHFGQATVSTVSSPPLNPQPQRVGHATSWLSKEDEQLRTQMGWAAFLKLQRERNLAEARGELSTNAVPPIPVTPPPLPAPPSVPDEIQGQ